MPRVLWHSSRRTRTSIRLVSKAAMKTKISKNQPTIKQLQVACRHVDELMAVNVTENHAIRTLELFTDVYAKLLNGGSATPHHVDQVKLWSIAARKWRRLHPKTKPGRYLRVEHGTPRRGFARKVLEIYRRGTLSRKTMDKLVRKYWKLAVITSNEDKRLNKLARSKMYKTPEDRWLAAGIRFPRKPQKSD